eukprot:170379-Pelagomonas_calceolata.AAC.3
MEARNSKRKKNNASMFNVRKHAVAVTGDLVFGPSRSPTMLSWNIRHSQDAITGDLALEVQCCTAFSAVQHFESHYCLNVTAMGPAYVASHHDLVMSFFKVSVVDTVLLQAGLVDSGTFCGALCGEVADRRSQWRPPHSTVRLMCEQEDE